MRLWGKPKSATPVTWRVEVYPGNRVIEDRTEGGIRIEILDRGWFYFVFRSDWIAPAAMAETGFASQNEALAEALAVAREARDA